MLATLLGVIETVIVRVLGQWVIKLFEMVGPNFSRSRKVNSGFPQLHDKNFWQGCSEKMGRGRPTVVFTVVLPSGRMPSNATYLALASDAIHIPEVCLELSRITRKAGRKFQLDTVLDIDIIEELRAAPACLGRRNLLLIGTPDINAVTALLIEMGEATFDCKLQRPGFYNRDSELIIEADGQSHGGKDISGSVIGLLGMYGNPWVEMLNESERNSRVVLVCGGCGVPGTIAATKFLLKMLRDPAAATNGPGPKNHPVRVVCGVKKSYRVNIKPVSMCKPSVEVLNIKETKLMY